MEEKKAPLPFDEIPLKSKDHRSQLVCSHHQATVCGTCCMDFILVNKLRYDRDYLLSWEDEPKRLERIYTVVQDYYNNPKEAMNRRPDGPLMSPKLTDLLEYSESQSEVESTKLNELVSYLCYVARSLPQGKERMYHLLDATVRSMPDVGRARGIAEMAQNKSNKKKNRKNKKARRKAAGKKKEKGRVALMDKTRDQFEEFVQEMYLLLSQAGVVKYGKFFDDFMQVTEAVKRNTKGEAIHDAMTLSKDDSILMTKGLEASFKAYENWIRFLLGHVMDGVPLADPSHWPAPKVLEFLTEHGVTPAPLPAVEVLVKVARELIKFSHCCIVTIDSLPSNKEAEALGHEAMGTATDKDRETIEQMNAPVKHADFIVESQIPPNLKLSKLPEWQSSLCEPVFALNRNMHRQEFGTNNFHEMLTVFDDIAMTYDSMKRTPSQDYLAMRSSDQDTDMEKSFAARPIGAWTVDTTEEMNIPLLAIEYHCATKRDGPSAITKFTSKLQKGTLFQSGECTSDEMDLLLAILRKNANQLAADDPTLAKYKQRVSKGWKFSVIRPVDPTRRGGDVACPTCGKPASKLCSKCKALAYCSRECQVADWSIHKNECGAKREVKQTEIDETV